MDCRSAARRSSRGGDHCRKARYLRGAEIPDGQLSCLDDNGTGKFTLPKSFEYDAVASVKWEAGKVIESRESRPDQRIKVADGLTPVEMTGKVCDVVSHKRIRPAIDRGLEHHLIIRVPGLRPPLKMNFNRLDQRG